MSASYAVHTDALGSVVALSDEDGVAVATYAYDPWGAPLVTTVLTASALDRAVAARQPFRYRGYTLDAETGLYYLPARYYDPQACRFLSPDPAAPSAGNPASLNPYVYCQDDPIGASDPTGAITDYDGDGRTSASDAALYASYHTKNQAFAKKWRAKGIRLYNEMLARQKALAAARAVALAAAKAAAADREARMAMAQARIPRFRVVDTPFGPESLGFNHVYVKDTQSKWLHGMNGSSWPFSAHAGNGGGPEHASRPVFLPVGMSPEEFMDGIDGWDGWDQGLYGEVRFGKGGIDMNDCHGQLRAAFEHVGVPYPGAPYGRFD